MRDVFKKADILLPEETSYELWSVVACDQYTSQRDYWDSLKTLTKSSPSSYNIVFPEVYLEDCDFDKRIKKINSTMKKHLKDNLFKTVENSLIYTERTIGKHIRRGIIGKVDLEAYDYSNDAQTPIRATEGTVLERIPPRVTIRENAPLEIPHIMLLVDDPSNDIFNKLSDYKQFFQTLYDFDLMKDGGHISGYRINDDMCETIFDCFENLAKKEVFDAKYDVCDKPPLLFAVGDGNHSLATAKECYNKIKEKIGEKRALTHPARYALVEVVNLHDPSLEFEAIHRVLFDVDPDDVIASFRKHSKAVTGHRDGQHLQVVVNGKKTNYTIKKTKSHLTVGSLQDFLDSYIKEKGGKVDYIHGEDVVYDLSHNNNIGFILPAMEKQDLFKSVIAGGSLPRKTFSMGSACEKRFYLETRKIK